MDIAATIIATLISSIVASLIARFASRKDTLRNLNGQLDDILRIGIEYPYLENPRFTNTWNENRESNEDDYLRYENYCTLVFNYMERLSSYYKYNTNKIENHLNIRDWIRVHRQCWENPSTPFENIDSYEKEFKQIIESYLK